MTDDMADGGQSLHTSVVTVVYEGSRRLPRPMPSTSSPARSQIGDVGPARAQQVEVGLRHDPEHVAQRGVRD
jgi:hypothetical protein